MSKPKCEHEPGIRSAAISDDCLKDGRIILDIWCLKCGKSGSTEVMVEEFDFDDEDVDVEEAIVEELEDLSVTEDTNGPDGLMRDAVRKQVASILKGKT
jgi:hypothetical protein